MRVRRSRCDWNGLAYPAAAKLARRLAWRLVFLAWFASIACWGAVAPASDLPANLNGVLFFHRYSSYDAWDGKLYRYDFSRQDLKCLSDDWPIDHAMNANCSPDGKRLVFMGAPAGKHRSQDWDVYLWEIDGGRPPENLTAGNDLRDEDPKFSPDGRTIVFKQAGRLQLMDLDGKRPRPLAQLKPEVEWSMPIFLTDGKHLVAMHGAGAAGDLMIVDLADQRVTPLAATPRVQEYYPITWDADRVLFVRWRSAENKNDQIHRYLLGERSSAALPFCQPDANYSDPWPVDKRRILFSSTRAGGGYDLYLGDAVTGEVEALSAKGINTSAEELGACYRPGLAP